MTSRRREPRYVQLYLPSASTGLCGVVALAAITARDLGEIKTIAKPFFHSPQGALSTEALYDLAAGLMGRAPQVSAPSGVTAEEAARGIRLGIVTSRTEDGRGHAMPVVEGALFNKCGYGGEQAMVLMSWMPRRGEIEKIVKKWA